MAAKHVCIIEPLSGTPAQATIAEAKCLIDAGLRVTIVADPRVASTLDELPESCRRIILPVIKGRFARLRMARACWRESRKTRSDYYHAHSSVGSMLMAAAVAARMGGKYYGDFNNIIIAAADPPPDPDPSPADTFEHEAHWQRDRSDHEQQRIDATVEFIPEDAHSALDIGCGDGRITNHLAQRMHEVIGIDRASAALKLLKPNIRAMQGSAESLPLSGRSVDLVLASEVIEHLPDAVLAQALSEMQRVARKYIVIGVPFEEQLKAKDLVCPRDGRCFNVNGHYRRFDRASLRRLFDQFDVVKIKECGAPQQFYYHPLLRWIKQRLGGTYARPPLSFCPECAANLCPTDQPERNAIARWCDEKNQRLRKKRTLGRSHVLALYRRND